MLCASTWRRRLLLHLLVLLLLSALSLSAQRVYAHTPDGDPSPSPNSSSIPLTPGFQDLVDTAPDVVGVPAEAEHAGDADDSVVVRTSTGLLYWEPGLAPSWTGGYERLTLDAAHQVVQWAGDAVRPPNVARQPVGAAGGVGPRIKCIAAMESGFNPNARNRQSWGRYGEHATGLLQFLPSTWATTPQGRAGRSIWDPQAQIEAGEWMLRVGRGREFAGVAWGIC